ncbi:MAG: HepT-like ribonuclease domain-containing protein [Candidatus Omnitrophota bacterium]
MNKNDLIRYRHMLEATEEALALARNRSRPDIEADRTLLHSFVRLLSIIGEAASRVDPECRAAAPKIDWRNIINMRNRLIHEYFDINVKIVWKTVDEYLPSLAEELKRILDSGSSS